VTRVQIPAGALINYETKLKTLEKETTNALEMATKTHEERKKKTNE